MALKHQSNRGAVLFILQETKQNKSYLIIMHYISCVFSTAPTALSLGFKVVSKSLQQVEVVPQITLTHRVQSSINKDFYEDGQEAAFLASDHASSTEENLLQVICPTFPVLPSPTRLMTKALWRSSTSTALEKIGCQRAENQNIK